MLFAWVSAQDDINSISQFGKVITNLIPAMEIEMMIFVADSANSSPGAIICIMVRGSKAREAGLVFVTLGFFEFPCVFFHFTPTT